MGAPIHHAFRLAMPLILLCTYTTVIAQDTPTTEPAASQTLAARQLQERLEIERNAGTLPTIGRVKLKDLIQLRLREKTIGVLTSIPQTQGQSRAEVIDLPGISLVNVVWKVNNNPAATKPGDEPALLNFEHYDFNEPDSFVKHVQVLISPVSVGIVQDSEGPAGMKSIELQQNFANAGDGPMLHLRIRYTDEKTGATSPDLDLSADDFPALRRAHPREVAQYLDPIFRRLQADESLSGVDTKAVWQVLADTAPPLDPVFSAKLNELIARLDAEAFADREDAFAELEKLGQPAALGLMKMPRAKLSAEQRSRIDTLLVPYRSLPADDAARLRNNASYLIDSLYSADAALAPLVIAQLKQLTGKPIEFNLNLTGEDRVSAVLKLRKEIAPPPTTLPSDIQKND